MAENALLCSNCNDVDCVYNKEFRENSSQLEKYAMARKVLMGFAGGFEVLLIFTGYQNELIFATGPVVLLLAAGIIYLFVEKRLETRRREINAHLKELFRHGE